ncbi:AIPR family protein [Streptomyces ambofaciens]
MLKKVIDDRTDLQRKEYGDDRYLLFALQLHQGIEDIHAVAADSLTDGGQDHGCDLVYIDRGTEKLIIAQGYEDKRQSPKDSAPAWKASSLNEGVAWLLNGKPDALPERLRPAGEAIHQALREGAIKEVQFWYVHNRPESVNIQAELDATARMTEKVLIQVYGDNAPNRVIGMEVGVSTLYRWYEGSRSPILVTDEIPVTVDDYFELANGNWRAVCTAVDTAWLQNLYWEHNGDEQNRLFSANVRGFVGVKGKQGAINSAIRQTVQEQPDNLFVLNNGITALTRNVEIGEPDSDGRRTITLHGLSIVNGAQTTGAVSDNTLRGQTEAGKLMIRFVVCDDTTLVDEVIRTTNRQLATQPADFRSNDRTQLRLIREFKEDLGGIAYDGGRRTAPSDITKVPPANKVVATTAAKALAAFHDEPYLAYLEPARIWSDDALYARLFGDHTKARHVLFCYGLHQAVQKAKSAYAVKCREDPALKGPDRRIHEFFQLRGSVLVVVNAVAECTEILLGHGVNDPFALGFKRKPQIDTGVKRWSEVLKPMLPFVPLLAPALQRQGSDGTGDLGRKTALQGARENFAGIIYQNSAQDHVETAYAQFRQTLEEKAP